MKNPITRHQAMVSQLEHLRVRPHLISSAVRSRYLKGSASIFARPSSMFVTPTGSCHTSPGSLWLAGTSPAGPPKLQDACILSLALKRPPPGVTVLHNSFFHRRARMIQPPICASVKSHNKDASAFLRTVASRPLKTFWHLANFSHTNQACWPHRQIGMVLNDSHSR